MKEYNIKIIKINDDNNGYIEYSIYCKDIRIGLLQTVEDTDNEYIFVRQLHIFQEYQRNGIGTYVVDNFIMQHNKPFRFCIALNSEKAIKFWNKYLENTKFNKKNIRGETWEVWK